MDLDEAEGRQTGHLCVKDRGHLRHVLDELHAPAPAVAQLLSNHRLWRGREAGGDQGPQEALGAGGKFERVGLVGALQDEHAVDDAENGGLEAGCGEKQSFARHCLEAKGKDALVLFRDARDCVHQTLRLLEVELHLLRFCGEAGLGGCALLG